jgi:hypothetical protein
MKINADDSSSRSTLYCSFCGKSQTEVHKLIAGPTVFIGNECVDHCGEVLDGRAPLLLSTPSVHDDAVIQKLEAAFPKLEAAPRTVAALSYFASAPASGAPRVLLSGPLGAGKLALAREACLLARLGSVVVSAPALSALCAGPQQTVQAMILRALPRRSDPTQPWRS